MERENLLKENIYNFIDERLNESYNNLIKNKEYRQIEQNYSKSFKEIGNCIKNNEIIEKYEKNRNEMYDIQSQEAYKTGFMDAIMIFFNNIENK